MKEEEKHMGKRVYNTKKGPEAKGPYSTVAISGNTAYVAGQGPVDPQTGEVVKGSIEAQTERVLENIKSILEEIGSDLQHVLKTTVYLSDISNFSRMNEVYAGYLGPDYPARTCIEAARLPLDIDIEIEVIAEVPDSD